MITGEVGIAAQTAFRESANRIYRGNGEGGTTIGTLGERMLHAILKGYVCPDTLCHEKKVGRYHADVLCDGHIYEIQTRRLDRLCKKLGSFLPLYEVTVVYPIAATKRLSWLDPRDGTVTPPRKSPRHGSVYDSLYELYSVRDYLSNPHFHFRVILCDMQEYRSLTGYGPARKIRAPRAERIPTVLVEDWHFDTARDYATLIPQGLPRQFTRAEYGTAAHLPPSAASRAVEVLTCLGLLRFVGKRGRAFLYEREEEGEPCADGKRL